jgi:ADP-heptose:LPS heptosyltransferase
VFDFHLIGDIVLLTPLLKALRERYPDAHLCLVAGPWAAELLAGTDWVSVLEPFEAPWVKYGQGWRGLWRCLRLLWTLRKTHWDWGIEVRGDVRQIALMFFSGAKRRIGYAFTGGQQLLTDVVPDDVQQPHLLDHNRRIARVPHGRELENANGDSSLSLFLSGVRLISNASVRIVYLS